MIFVNDISQLAYYNHTASVPCYCELLVFPADLMLQAGFSTGYTSGYTLTVKVLSADGLTEYENATSYFEYYVAQNPVSQQKFVNLRLKSFSPAMCGHACYILRVTVSASGHVVFDKYTERYCQAGCCDTVRGILIKQEGLEDGFQIHPPQSDNPLEPPKPDGEIPTSSGTQPPALAHCGEKIIRLITKFDCVDRISGNYYGQPTTVYTGTANFSYVHVTNMRGAIRQRPRDVKREVSYNCKLQRSESRRNYQLTGYEYFAPWKMDEIESALHANHIYVDDFSESREYQWDGGTAFEQINNCFELFKLNVTLTDCTRRQIFGCTPECDMNDGVYYGLPLGSVERYYNERGGLIANSYAQLLDYIAGQPGVTAVTDETPTEDCAAYKIFRVEGRGFVPLRFFHSDRQARNRVFAQRVGSAAELCLLMRPACKLPEIGTITTAEVICQAPVIGEIDIEEMTGEDLAINGYHNWSVVDADTEATLLNHVVRFSIRSVNTELTESDTALAYTTIAVIEPAGRPSAEIVLTRNDNPNIPEDAALVISTNGFMRYTGVVTGGNEDEVSVTIHNIYYNI